MECQTYKNELPNGSFQKCCSYEVEGNHIKGVQIMKPNAATARVENRRHQQVVKIHSHGSQEDQPISLPVIRIVEVADQPYDQEMEGVMDECLEHKRKLLLMSDEFGYSIPKPKLEVLGRCNNLKDFIPKNRLFNLGIDFNLFPTPLEGKEQIGHCVLCYINVGLALHRSFGKGQKQSYRTKVSTKTTRPEIL